MNVQCTVHEAILALLVAANRYPVQIGNKIDPATCILIVQFGTGFQKLQSTCTGEVRTMELSARLCDNITKPMNAQHHNLQDLKLHLVLSPGVNSGMAGPTSS